MAGGHSLVPMMKLRLAEPAHLIDITGIADLRGIREEGNEIVIGAGQPAEAAMATCNPAADLRGPVEYRRAMVGEMTRRAIGQALSRAGGN